MVVKSFLSRIELTRREDPKKKKNLLDFLRTLGQVEGASDVVTMPQPAPREIELETRIGETTRYPSPEAAGLLGLEKPGLVGQPVAPKVSPYQKVSEAASKVATTPIFTVGGIGISAADLVSLGLLGYGAYQGAKSIVPLTKEIGDKTLQSALNLGLDEWIAKRSRGIPPQKFKTAQDFLYNLIAKNRTWLQSRATENMLGRMGRGGAKAPAVAEVVQQTVDDFENTLLPKLTVTNTAVPGQKMSMSEIIAGLRGVVPETAKGVRAPAMELKPEEMAKGTSIQPGLAGMGKEAQQVKAFEEFGTAPGAGGKKHGLFDVEALKAQQAAKPLAGQTVLPVTKEPWQMTHQEFINQEIATAPKGQQVSGRAIEAESITLTHRNLVQQALSEDKPVPPEVLKDYPDLAPKPTTAPVAGAAPVVEQKPITTPLEQVTLAQQAEVVNKEIVQTPSEYTEQDIAQMDEELQGLREWLRTERAATDPRLTNILRRTRKTGEVSNLTKAQYMEITGKRSVSPAILTKDGKFVRWEYALDDIATELGYQSSDALKEAIEKVAQSKDRIAQLENELSNIPQEGILKSLAKEPPTQPPTAAVAPIIEQPPPAPPAQPPTGAIPQPAPQPKPVPSLAGMNRIITQSQEVVKQDRPGLISNLIQKLPGIKQLRQFERPGLKMTGENEKLLVANVAETAARSDVATRTTATRNQIFKELETAFGKGSLTSEKTNATFNGSPEQAKNPITGRLKDIADNPELYALNDVQLKALADFNTRNNTLLQHVIDNYGAEVGQYEAKPNGAFLPNVDIAEDVVAIMGSETRAAASGRGKTRIWPTARERMAHDKTFKPETDVQKLVIGMDSFKASAAGGQTFREVIGGKTKMEVMQETHPELAKKMDALKKRLMGLRSTLSRLDEKQSQAIDNFLASPIEDADLTNLQAELTPRVGRAFGKPWGKAGVNYGKDIQEVEKTIDGVKAQLRALKPAWDVANLKPYIFVQEGIYRYFPAEQAKLLTEMRKTSRNPFFNALETIRATAFSGDLSPIVGVQTPLGILFDPIGSIDTAIGGLPKMMERGILHPFSLVSLSKDIASDTESWAEYFSLMGRAPQGTPAEFSGGLLGKIPGFPAFNEGTYILVTRQSKALFDRLTESLIHSGLPREQAVVVAADQASKVFPLLTPQGMGQSPARATTLRSLPTSYSFIRKPAEMFLDAARAYFKYGTGQFKKVTPKEKIAARLIITLAGSLLAVSATSNALSAQAEGEDPMKAMWDAINPDPMNGKFLTLRFGKYKVPIGGPYRAIFRAIYPQKVSGVPVPVPFAGIPSYLNNRVNPLVKVQLSLYKNQDYYGKRIIQGDFPENIARLLAYEAEGMLPLTLGTTIEGLRTGQTQEDIIGQAAGQFAGTNVSMVTELRQARDTTTMLDATLPKLGQQDTEAKKKATDKAETPNDLMKVHEQDWTYTTGDLASSIYNATRNYRQENITAQNGYPPIVLEYWTYKKLSDQYYDQLEENRNDFIDQHPEVVPIMLFWGKWNRGSATELQAVRAMAQKYNIPESAIPALNQPTTQPRNDTGLKIPKLGGSSSGGLYVPRLKIR